jgi:purine nucleosidase
VKALILSLFAAAAGAALPQAAASPSRVWIDADPACGVSDSSDPDDCLAIAALASNPKVSIVGISTVFGNAPIEPVEQTLDQLIARWGGPTPQKYRGAASAGDCEDNAAVAALSHALMEERLTVLALGPLTNIACLMDSDPRAAMRIDRIVAVMGAAPGHVFHPSEGSRDAILFGHGPIFSDFNAAQDIVAAERVLGFGAAMALVPYQTARHVKVTRVELARLSAQSPMGAFVAAQSQGWLRWWHDFAGLDGFYPFDLVGVAAHVEPTALSCQADIARVTADRAVSGNRFGPKRVLVGQLSWKDEADAAGILWCGGLNAGGERKILGLLGVAQ